MAGWRTGAAGRSGCAIIKCIAALRVLALALPLALAAPATQAAGGTTLTYPRAEHREDRRDDYPVALLKLALRKAGSERQLVPSTLFMLQQRAIREVEQGDALDLVWTMTSTERERRLLPIRIPIDRGLLGWRLLLVREASLVQFAGIGSLEQLRALRAGQGADWPDTAILQAAGFSVDASARYGDLFLKLDSGRIDHFPRSVQEIWGELAVHPDMRLAIEPTLAIHYPTAMYFFVNRARGDLAAEIEKGLRAALADGSFEALFQSYHGADLRRARLDQRRVFELPNPLLPAATPLQDAALWYRPRP